MGLGQQALRLVCVPVTKYVATLAKVVNVGKHKFHGTFLEYVATLAHALGATLASGLCYGNKICC